MATSRTLVSPHVIVPRVERHHALIELLRIRAPRPMTGVWLATELGVGVRTVERDIEELLAAGVAVRVTRGPGGGYAIDARGDWTIGVGDGAVGDDEAARCDRRQYLTPACRSAR